MSLYYFHQVGPNVVVLHPVGHHPDQGLPGAGRPVDPGFGVGGERPGHFPAFGGGRPIDPGYGVSGGAGIPDHELPAVPPPQVMPGWTLVLVRGPDMKWHYATIAPSSPPPRPTPEPIPPGGVPDQGLPAQPPTAGQLPGAPPTAQPKR